MSGLLLGTAYKDCQVVRRPVRFLWKFLTKNYEGDVVLRNGTKVHLRECSDYLILNEVHVHNVYYPALRRLKAGDIVFDVGAHIGLFTLEVARRDAMVYSFEPHPDNYRTLRYNLMENNNYELGGYGVLSFNIALGDRDGIGILKLHPTNTGGHSLFDHPERIAGGMSVKMQTLGSFCEESGIRHIDLLKLDIEDGELSVIRSIPSWLDVRSVIAEVEKSREKEMGAALILQGFIVQFHPGMIYAFKS